MVDIVRNKWSTSPECAIGSLEIGIGVEYTGGVDVGETVEEAEGVAVLALTTVLVAVVR